MMKLTLILFIILLLVQTNDLTKNLSNKISKSIIEYKKSKGEVINDSLLKQGTYNRYRLLSAINNQSSLKNIGNLILIEGYNVQNGRYVGQAIIDKKDYYTFNNSGDPKTPIDLIRGKRFSNQFNDLIINSEYKEIRKNEYKEGATYDGVSYLVSSIEIKKNKTLITHFEFSDHHSAISKP